MDGAYQDLGGGVFDDGRPPPEPVEPPVMRPEGEMPSCSACGQRETVERIDSPLGTFYCGGSDGERMGCGTVFNATDDEWRRWAKRRDVNVRKRQNELEEMD